MRKYSIILLVMVFFICLASEAYAAKGVVAYKKSGSDYFIVATNNGYAILEWYGGYDPDVGDVIAGDFESYGFKDIFNITQRSKFRVWVENFWLSEEDAIEEYFELVE